MNIDPSESWRWQDDPKAREIFTICRRLIAGQTGVGEACRVMDEVLCAMWSGYADWGHRDFRFFHEIAQATREFPVGATRRHWSAEALEQRDRDLRLIEAQHHERALSEAERILQYETVA